MLDMSALQAVDGAVLAELLKEQALGPTSSPLLAQLQKMWPAEKDGLQLGSGRVDVAAAFPLLGSTISCIKCTGQCIGQFRCPLGHHLEWLGLKPSRTITAEHKRLWLPVDYTTR